ncbi:MAG: M48 family metalloprotease [Acidobacteria bacterium]|nr:M48 family metalloprotease [Acidobacteriota bacterium]
MLLTFIENFVFLSSLLAGLCFVLAWAVRRLALHRWLLHPLTLVRFYSAALILPPVMAAWVLLAAFLPGWWLSPQAFKEAHPPTAHQLHLLSELTAAMEPHLAWLTLCLALGAAGFAGWSSLRNYVKVGELLGRLTMTAAPPPGAQIALVEQVAAQHGIRVGLVMSDYPLSFVWGYWHSRIVLSSGLLSTLTPKELLGVLEHEIAHHKRRDNLVKLFLNGCSYVSLVVPLSRRILQWRAIEVEMVCDEVATARTAAPLDIADALIKLRRNTAPASSPTMRNPSTSAFIPDEMQTVERRVYRLLAFAEAIPALDQVAAMSMLRKSSAFLLAALFISTLLVFTLLFPLAVHQAAETLIRFLA